MASISERITQLESTINQFLKHVDKIEVYLNNYKFIPRFLDHKKIQVFTSLKTGDKGDIGKFYQIEQTSDYVLTIDDDLIYPEDYVSKIVQKIDHYDKKAFICVHGNLLPKQKLASYYKDKVGLYFERALEQDQIVDVPGTGTLGYHTENIKLTLDIFAKPNMTDLWLAIYAKENNIPVICVERGDNWISQARGENFRRSIYHSSHKDDNYQTYLINNFFL